MILFYHLSKTGGVSILRSSLDRVSGRNRRVRLSEMPHWLARLRRGEADVDDVAFLSGHFPYGLDVYLDPKPLTFTVLRNPIEQTLSMYHTANHHEGKPERMGVYPAGDLVDLLTTSCGEPFFNNAQVRHLAGEDGIAVRGEVTEAHLERALDVVLNRMTAFGIAEYPAATIALINAALGTSLEDRRDNVSVRLESSDVSGDLLHLIWTANTYDHLLYQRCLEVFMSRLDRHRASAPYDEQSSRNHRDREHAAKQSRDVEEPRGERSHAPSPERSLHPA
jgi:hypothetical protein